MKMANAGQETDIKTQWPNKWASDWSKSPAIEYSKFAEAMHYILMDKCEGEALTRVRSVTNNDGIMEYMEVFKWFTETTGLAMTERMKTIMTPTPPKKEEDIADAIAKWVEQCKAVEDMGASYVLPESFRKIALKSLMIGRGKEYYETMEETAGTKYEDLLKKRASQEGI